MGNQERKRVNVVVNRMLAKVRAKVVPIYHSKTKEARSVAICVARLRSNRLKS